MKSYIISGNTLWFARDIDSFFNSKWHGLNSTDKHLLDYFALRHGSEWMSCTSSTININSSEHVYGSVTEKVEIKNNLILKYENLKDAAMMELGINMRRNYDNFNNKEYNIVREKNKIKVDDLIIQSGTKITGFEFEYKNHFPGAQRVGLKDLDEQVQNCLVLRIFFSKAKNLTVNVGFSEALEKAGMNKSLLEKYFINGFFVAGFPYFTTCWVRDFSICAKPLIKLGLKEQVKKTIESVLKFQREDGSLPSRLDDANSISDDSTPWFASALKDYYKLTKDKSFEDARKKCLNANSSTGMTWMDSVKRVDAFEIPWLFLAGGKKKSKKELRFEENINSLFLIYLKLLNKKDCIKMLEVFENNYTTQEGVVCADKNSPEFNINAYHNGSVWHFLTAMMSICEFENKRFEKAKGYLEKLDSFVSENCIFHLPETKNEYYSTGFAQLWSDALYEYAKLFIKTK